MTVHVTFFFPVQLNSNTVWCLTMLYLILQTLPFSQNSSVCPWYSCYFGMCYCRISRWRNFQRTESSVEIQILPKVPTIPKLVQSAKLRQLLVTLSQQVKKLCFHHDHSSFISTSRCWQGSDLTIHFQSLSIWAWSSHVSLEFSHVNYR